MYTNLSNNYLACTGKRTFTTYHLLLALLVGLKVLLALASVVVVLIQALVRPVGLLQRVDSHRTRDRQLLETE